MSRDSLRKNGVRFECQGSGNCCVSRGQYGFVYLTYKDRNRFAKFFGISLKKFSEKYCVRDRGHFWALKDKAKACIFLEEKRCTAYAARPMQCRTWPFWPENMEAKAWAEVASFCPGVGKGPVIKAAEIEKQLLRQKKSERELDELR